MLEKWWRVAVETRVIKPGLANVWVISLERRRSPVL